MNIAQINPAPSAPTNREIANRENALRSTGPITPEGKAIVSANALKHGIYAQAILLPHEDKAAFDELLSRLTREYATEVAVHGSPAETLVNSLHECIWRIARIRRTEAFLYTLGIREQLPNFAGETDPSMRYGLAQAAAYRADARKFDQLRRHENRLLAERRDLFERLNELAPTQEERRAASQPVAAPEPSAPESSKPAVGFVPSTPNSDMPHFTGPMRDIKRKNWLRKNALSMQASTIAPLPR